MKRLYRQKAMPNLLRHLKLVPVLAITMLLVLGTAFSGLWKNRTAAASCSTVSDCSQQITNTNSAIGNSQALVSQLAGQATTYQQTIDALQSQVNALQSQIASTQAQEVSLQQQIDADQAKLEQQKRVLGEDLKAMYVNGQMSSMEMLATSKNLSDFVDAETYGSAVQGKIQQTLTQITTLQNQLKDQQTQVKQLLATEQAQQSQLANAQSQQQQLLSYNESQQNAYNQQIAASKSNLKQLQANLAALNTTADSRIISSGVCGGGYPAKATNPYYPGDAGSGYGPNWGCNYAQDGSEDNWHMENRECVSYTAYMAATKYGVSASNWGNAYQWIGAAEAHGYTVDQTPAAGAIAIRDRDYGEPGDVGHAMYVQSVNGPDNITVYEYNENYNGTFDERTFTPSSYSSRGGMYYIHFN